MNCTDWNSFHSLEDVNDSYHHFLDAGYNNTLHSSIGMTPRERYLKDFDSLCFVEKSVVEESFLHRITRKVTPTATVSLFNVSYECPSTISAASSIYATARRICRKFIFVKAKAVRGSTR